MKFNSFKTVKICLMIKMKLYARKFLYLNFILQPLFQSAKHFYEKREGSGCGFGMPKRIIRIRTRISGTLLSTRGFANL
jgi:hypothetical protein